MRPIEEEVRDFDAPDTQVYVVLGMHRSATSMAALALSKIGIDMHGGECHHEDLEVVAINDRILETAGGSWDNPPLETSLRLVSSCFWNEIQRFVDRRKEQAKAKNGLWGFKDPRTVLTWDIWKRFLDNPIIVAVKRDENEVARSLQKRNGFALSYGVNLAAEYNRRLQAILEPKVG